jgi:hypothetical protein
MITCSQWMVLDNVKHGWPLACNMTEGDARRAHARCVSDGLIIDANLPLVMGQVTPAGEAAIIEFDAAWHNGRCGDSRCRDKCRDVRAEVKPAGGERVETKE